MIFFPIFKAFMCFLIAFSFLQNAQAIKHQNMGGEDPTEITSRPVSPDGFSEISETKVVQRQDGSCSTEESTYWIKKVKGNTQKIRKRYCQYCTEEHLFLKNGQQIIKHHVALVTQDVTFQAYFLKEMPEEEPLIKFKELSATSPYNFRDEKVIYCSACEGCPATLGPRTRKGSLLRNTFKKMFNKL